VLREMLGCEGTRAQGPACCVPWDRRTGKVAGKKRIESRAMDAEIQKCLEKCLKEPGCRVPVCGGSERERAEKVRRSMRYVWPTSPQKLRIGGRQSWKLSSRLDFF
jgi:hypothetical protein